MSIGSSARLIQTIRDLSLFYFVLVLWNTSQMRFLLIAIVADKNQETLKKNYAFSQWTVSNRWASKLPGKAPATRAGASPARMRYELGLPLPW